MTTTLRVVGENALMLYLGDSADAVTLARVQAATDAIEQALGAELVDLVPSYASVLILYDPLRSDHSSIARRVRACLATLQAQPLAGGRTVVLPVYYASESGADLEALAARAQLSVEEVIALHTATEYRVYAIGFAPGFAYLGEVDARIAAPRLPSPRARVPQGSVAIADRQTAVYPSPSPGGWNLIGCCPVPMFTPEHQPAMPVAVGDLVRFEAIGRADFLALGGTLP
ncbi:MAG: 5-oxoprolinase subunit PxpB [Halioglobus sp.]|nr:5-oxoprolinase subunit PxpB [Halioglobus sp.]